MRKIAGLVGVVGVFALIIYSVRGDEEAKLREIIDRAIKAHGGAENLEKVKASITKIKGKLLDLEYNAESALQWPDRWRTTAESKHGKYVQILNGDKGWIKFGALSRECSQDELTELKEQFNATCISLLSVLTDKAYKLSSLGEETIDGQTAVGVGVEYENFRDVNLYFDKESGLLLKMQTRARDQFRGGLEFPAETLYSDYKDVDGIMTAHKITIKYAGKVYIEGEVTEIKYVEKLDDEDFKKP